MWPWEHLAFGYICYSLYVRLRHGRAPDIRPLLVLAVATQFPDLVDKPLAWLFDVLPSARTLAHSLLVTGPVLLLAALLLRRLSVMRYWTAFVVGHLTHLLGDVLHPVLLGEQPITWFLFWPLTNAPDRSRGGLDLFLELFVEFAASLGTTRGFGYIALEASFLLVAVLLWMVDGRPGVSTIRCALTRRPATDR